jgi:L-ascorbate peroxidase
MLSYLIFIASIVPLAAFVSQHHQYHLPSFGIISNRRTRLFTATSSSSSSKTTMSTATDVIEKKESLLGARDMIDKIIDETNANPLFVRLAWHDSGTFDVNIKGEWPAAGGAIASIRFEPEINHGANAGLSGALKLLEPVKTAFPAVSYADIFQMASARGIELAGGPTIDMKYGKPLQEFVMCITWRSRKECVLERVKHGAI